MVICSPISTCVKKVVCLSGHQRRMAHHINSIMSQTPANSYSLHLSSGRSKLQYARLSSYKTKSCSSVSGFQAFQGNCFGHGMRKKRSSWHSLRVNDVVNPRRSQNKCLNISLDCQKMNVRLKPGVVSRLKCNVGPVSMLRQCASAALTFGLLMCYSTYEPVHAEAEEKEDDCNPSSAAFSHGKKVHTDYSVIGIPGDGRCLFRSIAHGAWLCLGKPAPDESLQRELADELRASVADEFLKRRKETEWFIEGDFDAYVSQMRKPHVWGGEPELLMASHVLQMPISVYMYDQDSGGLISIAEYGQEYGKDNSPIKVLYHGFGHYDALQIPGKKGERSRL